MRNDLLARLVEGGSRAGMTVLLVAVVLGTACTGDILPGHGTDSMATEPPGSTPPSWSPGQPPAPSAAPSVPGQMHPSVSVQADIQRLNAGRRLYDQNCLQCHGPFHGLAKSNRKPEQIFAAIGVVKEMRSFANVLSASDVQTISYALDLSDENYSCGNAPSIFSPQRLTRAEIIHGLSDAFELPPGDVSAVFAELPREGESPDGFTAQFETLNVDEVIMKAYYQGAKSFGALLWTKRPDLFGCSSGQAAGTCARAALGRVAEKAFRSRHAEAVSLDAAAAAHAALMAGGFDPKAAYAIAIARVLLSPNAWMKNLRTGPEATVERVAALFHMSASTSIDPSRSLPTQIGGLVADDRFERFARRFAIEWLRLSGLEKQIETTKDGDLPVSKGLLESALTETTLSLLHGIRENRPLADLLLSEQSFIDAPLAAHYGVPTPAGSAFARTDLSSQERRGLLTQASVLAATAGGEETLVPRRGHWVMENVMCMPLPPPPDSIIDQVNSERSAQQKTDITIREKWMNVRQKNECAGCHTVMDEIGLGLEGFGGWGERRSAYPTGKPVETYGVLPGDRRFADHRGLVDHLARSHEFRECLLVKLQSYALGRTPDERERCEIHRAGRDLGRDATFRDLLGIVLSSPSFGLASGGAK